MPLALFDVRHQEDEQQLMTRIKMCASRGER
jgi:hypothetical protein